MTRSTAAVVLVGGLAVAVLVMPMWRASAELVATPEAEPLVEPSADNVLDDLLAQAWEHRGDWERGPRYGMRERGGPPERGQRRGGPRRDMRERPGPGGQDDRMADFARMAARLRDLATDLGPDHPKVQQMRERMIDLRQSLGRGQRRGGPEQRWQGERRRPGEQRRPRGARRPDERQREPRQERPEQHLRQMVGHLAVVERYQQSVANPLQSIIMAAQGIIEISGEHPEMAIDVLQDVLEDVEPTAARTVIHLVLKDAFMRAGDREGAAEHLRAVIEENSRLLGRLESRERRGPPGRRRSEAPKRPAPPEKPKPERGPDRD